MTRMTLAERRQKLIAAALEVIARNGVAAATTRAIAAQAGMPLASFHYAFESHQALMAEATRTVLSAELERTEALELEGEGRDQLVADLLTQHLADAQARTDEHRRLLELVDHASRTAGQEQVPAQWRSSRTAILERKLARAAQDGVELGATPEQLADVLVTMCDGLTQTWLVTREMQSGRRAIELLSNSVAVSA